MLEGENETTFGMLFLVKIFKTWTEIYEHHRKMAYVFLSSLYSLLLKREKY